MFGSSTPIRLGQNESLVFAEIVRTIHQHTYTNFKVMVEIGSCLAEQAKPHELLADANAFSVRVFMEDRDGKVVKTFGSATRNARQVMRVLLMRDESMGVLSVPSRTRAWIYQSCRKDSVTLRHLMVQLERELMLLLERAT